MTDSLSHLRDLQKWRGAAAGGRRTAIPTGSIGGDVTRFRSEIERRSERFGNAAEVWASLIPEQLRSDTRLAGLSGGTLTVVTGSAATSYALDRLLRAGVSHQILTATNGKILRVRMRVGKVDA